jgi:hypothetical protein
MNTKQMEFLLEGVLRQYASIIELFVNENPEEVLTVKMSKNEKATIEKYAIVFYDRNDIKVYCMGSHPFKIVTNE